jgi:GAF domain-containing protein
MKRHEKSRSEPEFLVKKTRKPGALKRALQERDEALRFQAATQEILASIRGSVSDAKPVFSAIIRNVLRLFGTRHAAVFLIRGDELHLADETSRGPRAARARFRAAFPQKIDYSTFTGKALRSGKVSQLVPIIGNPNATAQAVKLAKTFGYDCLVVAPLVREGKVMGAIGTTHPQARRFTDRELALLKGFANQAVIAIENARLFNETKEALEQQTATARILGVMSSSPTDVQPVLDAVAESAALMCETDDAIIRRVDPDGLRRVAHHGPLPENEESKVHPIVRGSVGARAVLECRAIHIEDTEEAFRDESWAAARALWATAGKYRTMLAVPLVREGVAVGVIMCRRREQRPFTERQIALLKTFADQAVIAIENVRLFNETKEALERQTAISEILEKISGSPTDVAPVLEAVAARSARLCEGEQATVLMVDGTMLRPRVTFSIDQGPLPNPSTLVQLKRGYVTGRAALDGEAINVEDVAALTGTEYPDGRENQQKLGYRSFLAVPMMREGRAIGVIAVWRRFVRKFSDKHVALVKTFADQAAIGIENVRLFNETKEALEQQTATAEILQVIGGSPTDTQPVFDAIVNSGVRLFPGAMITVARPDGGTVRAAAIAHEDTTMVAGWRERFTTPLSRDRLHAAAILDAKLIDYPDAEAEKDGPLGPGVRNFLLSGNRAVTIMPMLRGEGAIGAISVTRAVPGPLSGKQIAMLRTFADQAVIAIENVRLFNETKEALEQQTATAEILKVISASPTDVQPVFEAIVRGGVRLFENAAVAVARPDGDQFRLMAIAEHDPVLAAKWKAAFPFPVDRNYMHGAAILDRAMVEMDDALVEDGRFSEGKRNFAATGYRAMTVVPMIKDGMAVGTISVVRAAPGPLTEKQKSLLRTFADQAVIAIENVRLFNETKDALERQTATAEILKVISSSPTDVQPALEAIVQSAVKLFSPRSGAIFMRDGDRMILGPVAGPLADPKNMEQVRRLFSVLPLNPDQLITARAIVEGVITEIDDTEAAGIPEPGRQAGRILGYRSQTNVPLLRAGVGIGAIGLVHPEPHQPLSPKELELVKTFADQAVIAIENVRLFKEIQEKSAQLEVANKHKSDFLANMSHELRTPLNAIIGFSEVLTEKMFGEVNEKQLDYLKDIHESGKHLLSLINDILDLSKIEAGRMDLEVSSFNLPAAISNAMTLVRERAQRHGVQLGSEIDPQLAELNADERKFKQIMLNLLSNAVKFTPDGGRVDVSARRYDGKVEVAVRDTGIGIAPEDQGKVFAEFVQVGRDHTRKAEGTGLGLALTKKFVELHGGAIRLESAPGKGSTFTFELPLR